MPRNHKSDSTQSPNIIKTNLTMKVLQTPKPTELCIVCYQVYVYCYLKAQHIYVLNNFIKTKGNFISNIKNRLKYLLYKIKATNPYAPPKMTNFPNNS